jgi:hypothetical protein
MRLWSLHPRYLDRQGLTAAWREALLAQAVLLGRTHGYTRHPQLQRFLERPAPDRSIAAFLTGILTEADARGYRFMREKIVSDPTGVPPIPVTRGQLDYEWATLRERMLRRSPEVAARWAGLGEADAHPLFTVVEGSIAPWERLPPRDAAESPPRVSVGAEISR